jgi:hypothetical protein
MAVVKKINDRKRALVKARKDSFIEGNRKERRAAAFASKKAAAEPVVTNELKAKAKAKKVKMDVPMDHVAEDLRSSGL